MLIINRVKLEWENNVKLNFQIFMGFSILDKIITFINNKKLNLKMLKSLYYGKPFEWKLM